MRIKVLGGFGGDLTSRRMTSFLVNGTIILDAGSISDVLSMDEQIRIEHILISHAHLDHTNALPFFLDHIFGLNRYTLQIHSTAPVIRGIREHLFNDMTWPDFSKIISNEHPMIRFHEIEPGRPFFLDGLKITAVRVNHIVPTAGFVLEEDRASVVYTSDTTHTDEIWERANDLKNLKAVFIEVSFPTKLQAVADVSKHLTPITMAEELMKCKKIREIRIFAFHIKPLHYETIKKELTALRKRERLNIRIIEQGKTYHF
jgi:ribonuclease BN (tRNA processing enzyme)